MKAQTPGISNVFQNSTILRIPFFQRQYVWGEKEWERFVQDMDNLVGARKKYFLGSLIFKEEEVEDCEAMYGVNEKYSVIDGQQRLTTLSIYLKALVSFIADENTRNNYKSAFYLQDGQMNPVLSHSINDRAAYQAVMWDNPLDVYVGKRVVEAYRYFKEALRNKSSHRDLLMAVYAHIRFVTIILDANDDEQQIFDTINSLGMNLTIDELMKNFLYKNNDEEAYRNNWKPAFDDDTVSKFWGTDDASRRQAASDENKTISNFFYHFVRIKMWDYNGMPGFDRKGFVMRNRIFDTCKAFVETFGADRQELANEIIAYSKLYYQYFNKENLNKRIPVTPGIERIACIAMAKESTIAPYVLYVLKNQNSEAERNKIFGYLETYLMRRIMCFNGDLSKNYVEFFSETLIGNRLLTFDALKAYIEGIEGNNRMPSDEEMSVNIHQRTYSDESNARLVFYMQETSLHYSNITGGYNYYLAEPIMPKPSRANETTYPKHVDEQKEAERKKRTMTLGNYLLLHKVYNPQDKEAERDDHDAMMKNVKRSTNRVFDDKKDTLNGYINGITCSNWFTRKPTWNEDEIDNRNRLFNKGLCWTL